MNTVITFVHASEVNEKLNEPCQILDVREPSEFHAKHIDGSHLLPLSKLDSLFDQIDRDVPIYLICRTGTRAKAAAEKLSHRGFNNLNVLQGGLVAWEKAGLPLHTAPSNVWAMDRQVRFAAGILILSGVTLAYTVSPFWIYLSIFVALGMVLSAITDSCGMALVLAKMPWNQTVKSNCEKRCQNSLIG